MSKNKNKEKNSDISLGDDFLDDLLNTSNQTEPTKKESNNTLVNESMDTKTDVDSDTRLINSLELKNLKELRQLAKEKGLTGYSKMKKDDLILILSQPIEESIQVVTVKEEERDDP